MSSISLQVLAYKHLIYLVPLHFTHKQLENTHNVLYALAKAQDLGTARGKTKSHNHIGIIIVSWHTTCTGSCLLSGNVSVCFYFSSFLSFPTAIITNIFQAAQASSPHHLPITVSLPVCFHLPKPSPTAIPGQLFLGLCLLLLFRDLFSFQLSNPKLIPLSSSSNASLHLHSNILWSHTLKQTKQENKNIDLSLDPLPI